MVTLKLLMAIILDRTTCILLCDCTCVAVLQDERYSNEFPEDGSVSENHY